MESDVPYELGDKIFIRGRSNSWELQTKADVELANHAYAEGRKAAEKYTEKMLVFAKDEVRKCHEEIRRLEDKYARNVYKMPPYNPSFDEKEHSELVEKGTTEGSTHWTPITNVELEILIKDFDELLHLANVMSEMLKENSHSPSFEMRFIEWKKARGLK